MTDQRREMRDRIAKALGRDKAPSPTLAIAELESRLPEAIPRPVWQGQLVDRFIERLDAAAGTHARLRAIDEVPAAVSQYLKDKDEVAQRLGITPHPMLQGLTWAEDAVPERDIATARNWGSAVAVGYCGIAETGSIVMPSGPERPTTLNFLPDHHIVVLAVADIVDYMEAVWDRLLAEGPMPRTVNVITGPSRTADVEQTLQLGAHGPRSLHVLLID